MLKKKKFLSICLAAAMTVTSGGTAVWADDNLEDSNSVMESSIESAMDDSTVDEDDDAKEDSTETIELENDLEYISKEEVLSDSDVDNNQTDSNYDLDNVQNCDEPLEETIEPEDDLNNSEEYEADEKHEEECLDEAQSFDEYAEIIWGEDSDYTWGGVLCTINKLNFRRGNNNTCYIYRADTSISGTINLPDKIKVGGEYYTLTEIDPNAFSSCRSLTGVNIPSNVISIGASAFSSCKSLSSISIPASVTLIGDCVFNKCSSLQGIYVDNDNAKYSDTDGVLFDKGKYTLIKYPEAKSETNYDIPSSVVNIGYYSFSSCESLVSVNLPSRVTMINPYAFSDCSNLTNINIPSSMRDIGYYAFSNCSSLTSIDIPSGVTRINTYTFWNCSSLTNITIPASVTNIDSTAFGGCSSLTSINIPSSVSNINYDAFFKCSSLQGIYVDKHNANYSDVNGVLFNKDKTLLIKYPEGKSAAKYEIPFSTTSIGKYSFRNCKSLTSIKIPLNVTSIGENAFLDCSSLTNVNISSSVLTSIGSYAFAYCKSLTNISIPSSVTSIGGDAFYNCSSLTSINIPSSVTSIAKYAYSNCNNLESIWTSAEQYNKFKGSFTSNPVLIESNLYNRNDYKDDVIKIKADNVQCFEVLSDGREIEIPLTKDNDGYLVHDPLKSESGTSYYYYKASINGVVYNSPLINVNIKNARLEKGFDENNQCIVDGIKYTFNHDCYLKLSSVEDDRESLEIPENIIIENKLYLVTSIDDRAFNQCKTLKKVTTYSRNLCYIGWRAFYGCSNLESIVIPASVTCIGDDAFTGCNMDNLTFIIRDESTEDVLTQAGIITDKVILESI